MRDEDQLYDIVDALVEIGEGHGVSAAQVALAWLLGRPGVTSVVIGARTEEQLPTTSRRRSSSSTDDERARLDDVSEPPLLYPYWHQAQDGGGPARPGRSDTSRRTHIRSQADGVTSHEDRADLRVCGDQRRPQVTQCGCGLSSLHHAGVEQHGLAPRQQWLQLGVRI